MTSRSDYWIGFIVLFVTRNIPRGCGFRPIDFNLIFEYL